MGSVATSHIGGGAVWWQSPSTALARGRGGKPPDLLYYPQQVALGFTGGFAAFDDLIATTVKASDRDERRHEQFLP